jgi:putative ATPase
MEQIQNAARTEARPTVDAAFVNQAVSQAMHRFDKGGDVFYDQISALHKSVRGSSPDASLYWLVRMLDGGADPRICPPHDPHGQRGHRASDRAR